MAYVANDLALVFAGGGGSARIYSYVTADSLATVMASGYFNDAVLQLKIGDVIKVTQVDAVALASRTSVTGSAEIVVATNNGTTVTSTTAGPLGGIVATAATTLAITRALHNDRVVVINSAAPIAITLPQATGSGARFRFFVGVVATATAHTIKVANATDLMSGYFYAVTTTSDNAEGFKTTATDDTISLNGTTKGGVVGDRIEIIDVATGVFSVLGYTAPTGTEVTPFSASV